MLFWKPLVNERIELLIGVINRDHMVNILYRLRSCHHSSILLICDCFQSLSKFKRVLSLPNGLGSSHHCQILVWDRNFKWVSSHLNYHWNSTFDLPISVDIIGNRLKILRLGRASCSRLQWSHLNPQRGLKLASWDRFTEIWLKFGSFELVLFHWIKPCLSLRCE